MVSRAPRLGLGDPDQLKGGSASLSPAGYRLDHADFVPLPDLAAQVPRVPGAGAVMQAEHVRPKLTRLIAQMVTKGREAPVGLLERLGDRRTAHLQAPLTEHLRKHLGEHHGDERRGSHVLYTNAALTERIGGR
jgi:hypothetical protein